MANYYCLMAGAPDLILGKAGQEASMDSFRDELETVVSDGDRKVLFYFFLMKDCANLARLLKNPEAQIVEEGNFTTEQYVDLITSAREMNFNVHRYPSFMSEFAREYTYNIGKKGYFAEDDILYRFYSYAIETCPNKLVRQWYKLNLDIANILTAFLVRRNGWNVADYIQGENEVTEMILTNNTKDFNLTAEYDYVADLMKIVDCSDPVEKEKRMDVFKWQWLDDNALTDVFSVEAVFAYLCKLDMLERWDKLDVEKGRETFRQIVEQLRGEARVPAEFQTKTMDADNKQRI